MLELFSLNIDVNENQAIPFNGVKLAKGKTAEAITSSGIQFNKSGVYMITVEGSVTGAAAGDVSIQLAKNGILDQSAISTVTVAATGTQTLGFTTLVQVPNNNTCCCSSTPTTIQIINTGIESTFPIIRLIVTKIC